MSIKWQFMRELEELISKHGVDAFVDAPARMLAAHLVAHLESMQEFHDLRDAWLEAQDRIGRSSP